jgi:TolB-like protein
MRQLCAILAAFLVVHGTPVATARAAPDGSKLAIAVVDFTNTSGDESFDYLSKTIPESLITALAEGGDLKIVERGRLEAALKEMKLQLSDIVDEATAVQLGKAVGANAIIVGSFVAIGSKLRISSRLIDVQTATVITGKNATGRVGEDIFRVMDEMADAMRDELLDRAEQPETIETVRVPVSKPAETTKKGGGGKTWLYVLGGAVVVGAGVGVAMALSGGDGDGDGDNDATVNITVTW